MEGGSNRLEIHTPVFDKKKKKYSVCKEGHLRRSPEGFGDSPLTSKQRRAAKSKKKRKAFQHFPSSPLQNSETCDEAEKATSVPKKHKKRRQRALGVDEETGVAYVLVDKENIENTPKNFRRDVDVVYVDTNKGQEPEADEPQSVPKSHGNESKEPPRKVREKKSRKHRKTMAPGDGVQGSPCASLALPEAEAHEPEAPLCVHPEGKIAQLLTSADKKKSKKKKRKRRISDNQGLEASPGPEGVEKGVENAHSEGSGGFGEVGTAEGRQDASSVKKKSKKRKRRSSVESPVAPGGEFSVPAASLEDTRFDALEDSGTSVEESVKPRPQEEKTQAWLEEVQRLEPANEEEGHLELAKDSETRCLSEDSRDGGDSDVDLDSAVKQLQEFIPDIKERAATTIKRMYRDDLDRFKEFKAQGVAIRFGKFSVKENKQLEKNVQEFLALTGIENADKLLYTDRYPEEKSVITDLKRKYAFRLHIGKGIARPWKLVYYRAKKMFDVNNYKGRYSKGDTEKLKIYQSLHGNDWKKIGDLVARSSLSVALKFSQISSPRNHGPWSKTETQKLIKAVEEVILKKMSPHEIKEVDSKLQENPEGCLAVVRESLYKGISWVEVEAKVETRNWMQCKRRKF